MRILLHPCVLQSQPGLPGPGGFVQAGSSVSSLAHGKLNPFSVTLSLLCSSQDPYQTPEEMKSSLPSSPGTPQTLARQQ